MHVRGRGSGRLTFGQGYTVVETKTLKSQSKQCVRFMSFFTMMMYAYALSLNVIVCQAVKVCHSGVAFLSVMSLP